MRQILKGLLIACVLLILSLSVQAQAKTVVIIPLFGDDAAAKWRGSWAIDTDYKKGDIVKFVGSRYIATTDDISSLFGLSQYGY